MRVMLKSKIHRATVTGTDLNYGGSISIDAALMEAVDILPFEKVEVVNVNNGNRFETYAVWGGRGIICLNGACARLGQVGDIVIILAYGLFDVAHKKHGQPRMIYVDKDNAICALHPYTFNDVKSAD